LASINEVSQRLARLVLGWWVTFIPVCNQPPRSTQPGHTFVGRRNEYQPKGGVALRLGLQTRNGSCVGGRKLCDFLVTHGPCLSCTIHVLRTACSC